jgi:hypothetical protein
MDNAKTEQADQNQIARDDVIKQARHDKYENAGNERDNRLQMSDADDHGCVPCLDAAVVELLSGGESYARP